MGKHLNNTMKVKEKVLPFLNSIVSCYMTVDSALKNDLPSTIANALALRDSLSNIVNKRMYSYTISVAQLSEEIEKHLTGFIKSLPQNEKFISAYTTGLFIAARNHQKEKLEALRNAVLNTALPSDIEEDLQLSFINYIDRLTPSHIVALQGYLDYYDKRNVDITEIENKYTAYLDELIGLGMLMRPYTSSPPDLATVYSNSSNCILADKGRQFLEFINQPRKQ